MQDKIFLDTNILIYAYSTDEPTKKNAIDMLLQQNSKILISTQVINEFINVMHKKRKVSYDNLIIAVQELFQNFIVVAIENATINNALCIANKYHYSYFDSLIIASSLESQCITLFTEDMHHGQIIENTLTIINPFD